jgi:hypothetical protein
MHQIACPITSRKKQENANSILQIKPSVPDFSFGQSLETETPTINVWRRICKATREGFVQSTVLQNNYYTFLASITPILIDGG